MYEAFFQFKTRPFPSTPRKELYCPATAIEASRQTLARCIERAEGPGLLVGGPGTGKSLVCELLADRFRARFHLVKLDHARFSTRRALLQAVMFELQLPYRGLDEGELRLALIEFAKSPDSDGLLLLIDEAQTLSARLIDEIRMIGNVIVAGQPRLRLVLAGDTALEERLTSAKLESFNQRIAARCYLQPLNYDETAAYMQAQVAAAGGDPGRVFTDHVWQAVYHASSGIPRLINQVCDHALMLAAARRRAVDATLIEEAWADLQQLPLPWPTKSTGSPGMASSVVEFGALPGDDPEAADDEDGDAADEGGGDLDSSDGNGSAGSIHHEPPNLEGSGREVIDLTKQLDQIELHVADWDAVESSVPPATEEKPVPADRDVATGDPTPTMLAPDPFDDCYEEEEEVRDHYAALEANSTSQGRAVLSPAEHEFTAALKTIFEPLSEVAGANSPSDLPARGEPAEAGLPQAAAAAGDPPGQGQSALAVREGGTADTAADETTKENADETEAGDEPVTFQVEALRSLPPDDSDLILVLDAEANVAQLSRSPGKAHRQEYRRLFTKLREN